MDGIVMSDQEWRDRQIDWINSERDWFGVMTLWNAEAIAKRLQRMLAGKKYTWVAVNSYFSESSPPEVRTGQYLRGSNSSKGPGTAENVSLSMSSEHHAHIGVCDSYGFWGLSSTTDDNDSENYRQPYLVFECRRGNPMVSIVHQAPAGHLLRWVIAVEPCTVTKEDY